MLRLKDRWVWDSWLADTGSEYHLFFLQAPRTDDWRADRDHNASLGHAVSTDLREWRVLPAALEAGPPGAWDDNAIWTGSTLRHGDRWFTFYTAASSTEGALVQRIGRASSLDLETWTKDSASPVIEADPRWYELLDLDAWQDQAWRDPWILPDPAGEGFHALITARSNEGPADGRGVIGYAWSADLASWEVRPPLTEPGEFGNMEVPQVEVVNGTPVLLFSCTAADRSAKRKQRLPEEESGTFVALGESLLGPFDVRGATRILVPDLYSAHIIRDRSGEWQAIGFLYGVDREEFIAEISDPVPLAALGVDLSGERVDSLPSRGHRIARRGPASATGNARSAGRPRTARSAPLTRTLH